MVVMEWDEVGPRVKVLCRENYGFTENLAKINLERMLAGKTDWHVGICYKKVS